MWLYATGALLAVVVVSAIYETHKNTKPPTDKELKDYERNKEMERQRQSDRRAPEASCTCRNCKGRRQPA